MDSRDPGTPPPGSEAATSGTLAQMASQLAHEVRNPIAVIVTAVGQLERQLELEGQPARLMSIVREEVFRLDRLVDDLVLFATPLSPRPETLLLEDTIMHLVDGTAGQAKSEGARVELEIPADLRIECDPGLLREALERLLHHAYRPGVTLRLRAWAEGDGGAVHLRLADDGESLAEDLAARVFEPFFSPRPNRGGLNLAVVRRLIEELGGVVAFAEPGEGEGEVFELAFPSAAPLDEAPPAPTL